MKRPTTTTRHSTDFDVISGPSMASACPIVESDAAPSALPDAAASASSAGAEPGRTANQADAA